jgi:hypothetical protein
MARVDELLRPLYAAWIEPRGFGPWVWRLRVYAGLVRAHLWLWRRGVEL